MRAHPLQKPSKVVGAKTVVEATSNHFWASGMNVTGTANTPPEDWPGQNTLGKLLMEIRSVSLDTDTPPATTTPEQLRSASGIQLADQLIKHVMNNNSPPPELMHQVDEFITPNKLRESRSRSKISARKQMIKEQQYDRSPSVKRNRDVLSPDLSVKPIKKQNQHECSSQLQE